MKASSAILLVIACSACTNSAGGAPVIAEMTDLTLRIPRDREFTQIHLRAQDDIGRRLDRRSVSFRICDQRGRKTPDAGCEVHGDSGTWVLVQNAPAGSTFNVLMERPSGREAPGQADLAPLSGTQSERTGSGPANSAEESALGRVNSDVWSGNPPLSTTDLGWPVADCDQHPAESVQCRFGFLISGNPVVAQWFSPGDQDGITQAQVWTVASDIDRRIRRRIVSPEAERS